MMSKMMSNLTDEQKQRLTPEVMEKGMKTMDQLHLSIGRYPGAMRQVLQLDAKKQRNGFRHGSLRVGQIESGADQPHAGFCQERSAREMRG